MLELFGRSDFRFLISFKKNVQDFFTRICQVTLLASYKRCFCCCRRHRICFFVANPTAAEAINLVVATAVGVAVCAAVGFVAVVAVVVAAETAAFVVAVVVHVTVVVVVAFHGQQHCLI